MALVEGLQTIKELNVNEGLSNLENSAPLTAEQVQYQALQTQENFAEHPLICHAMEQIEPTNKGLERLSDKYEKEVKDVSPFPETVEEQDVSEWTKQDPEAVRQARQEFNNQRDALIEEWEQIHGKKWPTYDEDIYSKNGVLIREKGDLYDAHHLQPLEYGGKNKVDNITPLHANDHYDRQGVHSPTSTYQEIRETLG